MEKSIDEMNAAELREALDAYQRAQNPVPTAPLPPGIKPEDSEKAREDAARLYTDALLARPAGTLTAEERAYLRGNINACLRSMNY